MSQQVKLRNGKMALLTDRELWIRGRVMVIFGLIEFRKFPLVPVSMMAHELSIQESDVYRSCPEMLGTILDVVG